MALDIYIVQEDLTTILPISHEIISIPIDDDFYIFRNTAKAMGLPLLGTLDDIGDTIINRLQLDILKQEIQQMRDKDVNQKILDILQNAIVIVEPNPKQYIRFLGD